MSSNPDNKKSERDFLIHLEAFLAKRDGIDKLLKISRYAAKIIIASHVVPENLPLTYRLRSFEASVGLSRKAFRLGKFVQDVNALRKCDVNSCDEFYLFILAYAGEGLYYFVEQFVWLSKSGLIDKKHAQSMGKVSVWAELVGYVGSILLKFKELKKLEIDEMRLISSIEVAVGRGLEFLMEEEKLRKIRGKKLLKRLSVVQDLADALMALGDIRKKGMLSSPLVLACAGLLSALISARKNWVSC